MIATLKLIDDIGVIEMNNGKVNAFSFELIDALNKCLDEAEAQAKAVVLYGGEGKFCGGFDLGIIQGNDSAKRDELIRRGGELIIRLYSFPKPLIIAADGHGVALGAIILMAGDYRFGAANAKFGLNETAIGLTLPPWGLALAQERLSTYCFNESVILAKIYDGHGAKTAGFLDTVAEQGTILNAALAYAETIKSLPSKTVSEVKRKTRSATLAAMRA